MLIPLIFTNTINMPDNIMQIQLIMLIRLMVH